MDKNVFGGIYVLFDLFAIAVGLDFLQKIEDNKIDI